MRNIRKGSVAKGRGACLFSNHLVGQPWRQPLFDSRRSSSFSDMSDTQVLRAERHFPNVPFHSAAPYRPCLTCMAVYEYLVMTFHFSPQPGAIRTAREKKNFICVAPDKAIFDPICFTEKKIIIFERVSCGRARRRRQRASMRIDGESDDNNDFLAIKTRAGLR